MGLRHLDSVTRWTLELKMYTNPPKVRVISSKHQHHSNSLITSKVRHPLPTSAVRIKTTYIAVIILVIAISTDPAPTPTPTNSTSCSNMATRTKATRAIFGESQEHDAVRLLMFIYIAMFDDEPTARDVPNLPAHEIGQRLQLLAKTFSDAATNAEATISSIESWTFNCELPLTKLREQLEALGKPRFDGDVLQAYYKWDEMRLAAGAFLDSGLESACVGVGQALSSLAVLSSQAEEMITSLRLRNVQATANLLRRRESVGHDIGGEKASSKAQTTQRKTRKPTPVVFEDWEVVAILTLPSIRAGGIAAELTTFRSLYYKASCFLERPLIHDCQFVIAVGEANCLEHTKLTQMMGTLITQLQQSIKSLQCLLNLPWSFHTSLQWQFDSLAKHDVQLHTTLHRAECLFLEWQVAVRAITNPLLNKAATDLGREIIALRLALIAVDTRHRGIRRKVEDLWAVRGEFIQGKIDRDGARGRVNKALSVEELQSTVKIHDHTILRTDLDQPQGRPSASFSYLMSEACLNNLTSPQNTPKELGSANLMTPDEALAALLVEHAGQPQDWKPEPVIEDPAELQRRYEANVDVFHYLFPSAEKPGFVHDIGNPLEYTVVPTTKKQVRWEDVDAEDNDSVQSDAELEAESDDAVYESDVSDVSGDAYESGDTYKSDDRTGDGKVGSEVGSKVR